MLQSTQVGDSIRFKSKHLDFCVLLQILDFVKTFTV